MAASAAFTNLHKIHFKQTMEIIEGLNRLEVEYHVLNEMRLKNQAYQFLMERGIWDEFERFAIGEPPSFAFA